MRAPTNYHMRGLQLSITIALLGLIALTSSVARGQDTHEEQPPTRSASEERALALFLEAEAEFEEGRVEHALELLLSAHAEHPVPVLLFNIARAYETLGREREALQWYRSYLEVVPNAPDRGAIDTRIGAIETNLAQRAQLEEDRRQAEARANAAGGRRVAPWVIAATGVATLGAGAVFGGLALSGENAAVAENEHMEAVRIFDRAERNATTANVLFIVGGVLSAAGVAWVIADGVRRSRAGRVEVSTGLTRVGVRVWLN